MLLSVITGLVYAKYTSTNTLSFAMTFKEDDSSVTVPEVTLVKGKVLNELIKEIMINNDYLVIEFDTYNDYYQKYVVGDWDACDSKYYAAVNADGNICGDIRVFVKDSTVYVLAKSGDVMKMNPDSSGMFSGLNVLTNISGLEKVDTTAVTNMSSMFKGCSKLNTPNLSKFRTENVKDMSYMFCGCRGMWTLDLSSFDTSKVKDMSYMFSDCTGVSSLNLSTFDTSNVTNMNSMFAMYYNWGSSEETAGSNSLKELNISNFDTSNVKDMSSMFYGCQGLTELNLKKFDTAKVTNMNHMFYNCYALSKLVIPFKTANVTDMSYMFKNCYILCDLDVGTFDTVNVIDMSYMFAFNSWNERKMLDLSSFNTSKVKNMEGMFYFDRGLKIIYVSEDWSVDACKGKEGDKGKYMFAECGNLRNFSSSKDNDWQYANYGEGGYLTYKANSNATAADLDDEDDDTGSSSGTDKKKPSSDSSGTGDNTDSSDKNSDISGDKTEEETEDTNTPEASEPASPDTEQTDNNESSDDPQSSDDDILQEI
jgi:surface protein